MSDWKSSSWESADSASKMSSVSKTMGTKTKTISSYCWSSNSTYSWGSNSGDSWGSNDGDSWLSNGVDNLMGFVVGAGLVDWLVDLDFSGDWSNDGLLSENGLFSKDWAS